MLAIQSDKLSRAYGQRLAVAELNLHIEPGEIFGFLGSNGAGKTTTIKMLTGQLRPTSGEATVMGHKVNGKSKSLAQLIGVVFEAPNLYPSLSAYENLRFAAELYSVSKRRINELLDQMGLLERAKDRVDTYSTGMKQKLSIARALLHRPRVLFLDEPTSGLDPLVSRTIRDMVKSLPERSTTVFLTTHYMDEAEQLCDRVAFLERGEIILQDTPENLKRKYGKPLVGIELRDGRKTMLSLEDAVDRKQLAEWSEAGLLASLYSQDATLDDVFVEVVGRQIIA